MVGGASPNLPNFEFDEAKSESNKIKHGLDFEQGQAIWLDPDAVQVNSSFADEQRILRVGKICDKLWTVVFTLRDDAVRLISVRRARPREARLYGKEDD